MKQRAVRMLVLFWLAWYVSGPVCEWFDFWDPPRAEMHDVVFYAGGGITLVAAGFGLALALYRKLRQRSLCRRSNSQNPLPLVVKFSFAGPSIRFSLNVNHSPPIPLRI